MSCSCTYADACIKHNNPETSAAWDLLLFCQHVCASVDMPQWDASPHPVACMCSHGLTSCHVALHCCTAVVPPQVHGYAIYKSGKYAIVKYPTEGYTADVAGRSFHHGRFVQRLRTRAAAQPSVTCREATVRRLINGESALDDQGNAAAAAAKLLCLRLAGRRRSSASIHTLLGTATAESCKQQRCAAAAAAADLQVVLESVDQLRAPCGTAAS